MKKQELQKVLKPLIKECIKEVIFEEGVLSSLIKEVAQGLGAQQTLIESAPTPPAQDFSRQRIQVQEEAQHEWRSSNQGRGLLYLPISNLWNGSSILQNRRWSWWKNL